MLFPDHPLSEAPRVRERHTYAGYVLPSGTSYNFISSILTLESRNMYDSSVSSVVHILIRYTYTRSSTVHREFDPDKVVSTFIHA